MRKLFFGLILTLLLVFPALLASHSRTAAFRSPAGEPIYIEDVPVAEQLCEVNVRIRGGGQVRVLYADGRSTLLNAQANRSSFSCTENVRLLALPQNRWRFVGWETGAARPTGSPVIIAANDMEVTAVFELAGLTYLELDQPTYDRSGQLVTALPVVPRVLRDLSGTSLNALDTQPPEINLWYGTTQKFGQTGTPQVWVNIVGNVADPEKDTASLSYKLNGGAAVPLRIGGDGSQSDKRRLQEVGDFNIDLATADLTDGPNQIVISATDSLGNDAVQAMTLNFEDDNTWPLPFDVRWNATGDIQDVAHVVDGKWNLVPGGVRTDPNLLGYDRILALGDIDWTDFQVTVPVTVHALDPAAYNRISVAPALGIILRWLGHTDVPVVCDQPKCGWLYPGASSWYDYDREGSTDGVFSFWVNHNQRTYDPSGLMLQMGESYYWQARAESPQGTQGRFKMKIWKTSDPEPANWLMQYDGTADSLQEGSILLLAHHVDVTFGDFSVCPVSSTPDDTPPVISNVTAVPGLDKATISWMTNEPAAGQVDFGLSAVYTATVTTGSECATTHELILEDLNPDQEYHFQVAAADIEDNEATTNDATFTTLSGSNGQEIELQAGWNMISSYVQLDDPLIENVLLPVTAQTVLVKNGRGEVYWPAFGVNQFGSWANVEGYQIYMNQAAILTVAGDPLDPAAAPINLAAGFNMVAYLRDAPMPVDQALAGISAGLILAKDGQGHVYWPDLSINSIGSMQPGQGYQLYLNQTAVLTYPANG